MPNSNFLKGGYTKDNGQRVIDYNDVISKKIDTLRQKAAAGEFHGEFQNEFITGLSAKNVESLIGEESRILGGNPLEEIATDVAEEKEPEINEAEVSGQAEEILNDAHARADELVAEANAQAGSIRDEAKKEGFNAGYMEGNERGYSEGLEKAQMEYAQRLSALDDERSLVAAERVELEEKIQPQIIDTILDVVGQVTGIVYENNKDILIHLINRVLQDVEASNEYTIHVSKEDYNFVVSRQSKLYCATVKDVNIDVVEDGKLTAGKCLIETDGGIFDCSLDVQMEQLIQDIRLLAGV